MRTANVGGRLSLIVNGTAVDVEKASNGEFSADPQAIYERWDEFRAWADRATLPNGDPFDEMALGSPAPSPTLCLSLRLRSRSCITPRGRSTTSMTWVGVPPRCWRTIRTDMSGVWVDTLPARISSGTSRIRPATSASTTQTWIHHGRPALDTGSPRRSQRTLRLGPRRLRRLSWHRRTSVH